MLQLSAKARLLLIIREPSIKHKGGKTRGQKLSQQAFHKLLYHIG
jgi:hypothetical protein